MRGQEIPSGYQLVCYDYGSGGAWWLIRADRPDQIESASSQLKVVEKVPDWMNLDAVDRDHFHSPQSKALRLILAGMN